MTAVSVAGSLDKNAMDLPSGARQRSWFLYIILRDFTPFGNVSALRNPRRRSTGSLAATDALTTKLNGWCSSCRCFRFVKRLRYSWESRGNIFRIWFAKERAGEAETFLKAAENYRLETLFWLPSDSVYAKRRCAAYRRRISISRMRDSTLAPRCKGPNSHARRPPSILEGSPKSRASLRKIADPRSCA
jgi:hypothetical protein